MDIFNLLYFVMCKQKLKLIFKILRFCLITFSSFAPKSRYFLDQGSLELSCLLVLE